MSTDDCYRAPPESPSEAAWPFEKELQRPLHGRRPFGVGRAPGPGELDFRSGVHLDTQFPDPDGLLETAYVDFRDFCASIGLKAAGSIPIATSRVTTGVAEEYRISVRKDGMVIAATDTEGIRRGLVNLEEMVLARDHYALERGVTRRKPFIRTRLSRCFYGPINRPPLCRDELMDDRDYYPDGYLRRLAHHGINGLWLTIRFADLLPSGILPELGTGSQRRLRKLRRIVRQCARYGIKIYPFCIEPAALALDGPVLRAHPELRGADAPGNRALFCTSSMTGRAYLEDTVKTLFDKAPGLGGLLCIPVGERFTHCYSGRLSINCPRCSKREPWDVLADALAAMERGMHAVDPGAELIAWPYGQLVVWGPDETARAAGHMPPNVALQHNFETGGRVKQLGRWRPLWDYWLSWVGPSRTFADCAEAARRNGTRMFAKLQTSCSHEVATTQYVPVPGILYRKYRRMRTLGASGVMQGWYFGNHPSIMTRASRLLSFAPLPRSEEEFLRALAAPAWGRHATRVARAWQHFADGYGNYPGAQIFGYYGPMHDGVVWPLYLEPRHLPLAPTWRTVHPPSGDAVGECVSKDFEYHEVLALCKAVRDHWRKGAAIFRRLEKADRLSTECRREINVALALGVQFESGYNILHFYQLRDRLATARTRRRQTATLHHMKGVVLEEIENGKVLLKLCANNKTLGFHSEAEDYKYFPYKIRWRIKQLRTLLRVEFPRVEAGIDRYPLPAFENYVGEGDSIQSYACAHVPRAEQLAADPFHQGWGQHAVASCRYWAAPLAADAERPFPFQSTLHPMEPPSDAPSAMTWRAVRDRNAIHFCVAWPTGKGSEGARSEPEHDEVRIAIQPDRLGPSYSFTARKNPADLAGTPPEQVRTLTATKGRETRMTLAVPFRLLGDANACHDRLRVHVSCFFSAITDALCFSGRPLLNSWAPVRRTMPRNLLGYLDPAAFGWLIFDESTARTGRKKRP